MNFLVMFVILSIVNVIFSTVRSIVTIKGGKLAASLISGGYFAFYNVMLIFTVADFPLWQKCVITFACNVVGVWVVKLAEEKMRKDRVWKVEMTIRSNKGKMLHDILNEREISHNYVIAGKWWVFNCYADTQQETAAILESAKKLGAKTFATETKLGG